MKFSEYLNEANLDPNQLKLIRYGEEIPTTIESMADAIISRADEDGYNIFDKSRSWIMGYLKREWGLGANEYMKKNARAIRKAMADYIQKKAEADAKHY